MLLALFCIGLLVYSLHHLLYESFPNGWEPIFSYRIFHAVFSVISSGIDMNISLLKGLGCNRAIVLRWFMNKKKTFQQEGVEVFEENWNGVPVYIFQTSKGNKLSNKPGILYIHGGGWITGNVNAYSRFISNLAKHTDAVVVSPDYRKAPEHPFPAAFDDCYAVTSHFMEQADRFNVDKNRIALTGDSAGGNLSAAVAHRLCNDKLSPGKPKLLFLLYPVLQFTLRNLPSAVENDDDSVLSSDFIEYFKLCYMGFQSNKRISSAIHYHAHLITDRKIGKDFIKFVDPDNLLGRWKPKPQLTGQIPLSVSVKASEKLSEDERTKIRSLMTNPLMSPLHATDEDLKNLPKTHIIVGSADPLRDEAILYYERLLKVGVDADIIHLKGTMHAFMSLSKYFNGSTVKEQIDRITLDYFNAMAMQTEE